MTFVTVFSPHQNFGSKERSIETEAASIAEVLDAFVAKGGNFIDTADVYHGGRSEQASDVLARRGMCMAECMSRGELSWVYDCVGLVSIRR